MGLQLQMEGIPHAAAAHLLALGALPTPAPASPLRGLEPRASPEGEAGLARLGLLPTSGAGVERPRLLEALRAVAQSETVLHLEVEGDALSFAVQEEALVPLAPLVDGVVVGEAVHVSQVVKRLRQLLASEPGRLRPEAVSLRGTQAVLLVWGALRRSVKATATAAEVATLLAAAGLPGDVDAWFTLGAEWLERRGPDYAIVEARQALATLLTKGRTVSLARQEGFELVLDVEVVGRSGRWMFASRTNPGAVDETLALAPATDEATSALIERWVGLTPR